MNHRFSEYTTSGAFALTLTRNQVSAVAMLDEGSAPDFAASVMAALERKGLAERLPAPADYSPDKFEFRPTRAGLLTAALCREAGLTNTAADPVAAELDRLRQEVVDRRRKEHETRMAARSALARLAAAEHNLAVERAKARGDRLPIYLLPKDPLPELTCDQLRQRCLDPDGVA